MSFLNQQAIINIASDDIKYYKMPFLYLIFSYVRNQSMDWASENYKYVAKKKTGGWMIYQFKLSS